MEQESDPRLVELAQAGDQQAFAELYNRYFDPVYDFVARMVRNRDEAADIAQDTFLKAMNSLSGLQKGASFKGWIFTIARNTALNRLERSKRMRPLAFEDDDGEEVSFEVVDTDRFADPAEAAEANAMSALVWQAAAGLDPKQLSLLDLHLRQGLDSGEIADALGVTKNNGYVMLNRLKKAVEEAIGAFIMFKDGRRYCDDLNAALGQVDIEGMSPEVRKLVDRHVAQCEVCSERKKKLVAPLAVFSAFAMVGPPTGAKAQILEGLMRQWPPAGTAGGAGGGGAGGGGGVGGSAAGAGGRGGGYFLKMFAGLGLAASFLLALLLLPLSPIALTRSNREKVVQAVTIDDGSPSPSASAGAGAPSPSPSNAASPGAKPTASPSASPSPSSTNGAGVSSPSPSSTASSTPTGTASPSPSPVPTTAVPTKGPPPTSTPTATPTTACTPSLSTNIADVNLTSGSNSFSLLNGACGTVSFSIFYSSQQFPWLHVSPTTGDIAPFGVKTINLTADVDSLAEGIHSVNMLITWAGGSGSGVVVSATVNKLGNPPQILRPSCGTVPATNFSGYRISAQVTDDYGLASVVVDYTDSNGSTGNAVMTASGSLYSAQILSPVVSYTITARDQAGQTKTAGGTCGG